MPLDVMSPWKEPFSYAVTTFKGSTLPWLCALALRYFRVAFKALLTTDRITIEPTASWIAFFEWGNCLFTINDKTTAFFPADSNNEISSVTNVFLILLIYLIINLYSVSWRFFFLEFYFPLILSVSCFDLSIPCV